MAAKAATQTIPIVFSLGSNPVEVGLVQSLNHPGGNVTGLTALQTAVTAKRLEFMHELIPGIRKLGFLVNPANRALAESDVKEAQESPEPSASICSISVQATKPKSTRRSSS